MTWALVHIRGEQSSVKTEKIAQKSKIETIQTEPRKFGRVSVSGSKIRTEPN